MRQVFYFANFIRYDIVVTIRIFSLSKEYNIEITINFLVDNIEREACMGKRGMDFKSKEVINISDARRLGFVQDVCADLETGKITSIVVPGSNKLLSMFTSENDIVITWDKIKCIGEDIILVEI